MAHLQQINQMWHEKMIKQISCSFGRENKKSKENSFRLINHRNFHHIKLIWHLNGRFFSCQLTTHPVKNRFEVFLVDLDAPMKVISNIYIIWPEVSRFLGTFLENASHKTTWKCNWKILIMITASWSFYFLKNRETPNLKSILNVHVNNF